MVPVLHRYKYMNESKKESCLRVFAVVDVVSQGEITEHLVSLGDLQYQFS